MILFDNNNNIDNIKLLGHWSKTSIGFSLTWECGHFCPPESGVAPLASDSNTKATPVRVTTMGWWDSIVLVNSPPRRWKTPNLNPVAWGLLASAGSPPGAGITNKSTIWVVGTHESSLITPLMLVEQIKHWW